MIRQKGSRGAIGFTVKSGWACAVLLTGSRDAPQVADARRVELSDPTDPDARQPYHAGFGTARAGGPALTRLLASVKRFGHRSMDDLLQTYEAGGNQLVGSGIVVGSLTDPDTIHNDHIRIHALEGRLFRSVVEEAVARKGLPCAIWREKDLYAAAASRLEQPEPKLRARVGALGRTLDGPWRAEQKASALAAWLVLAQ
jgi:hypothetical protein